jgi:hypothetical protein
VVALVGGAAILVGAVLALRAVDGQRRTAARVAELRDCRLRLLDTRSTLEHSSLSHCTNDLGEADEDLMAWESRLKAGTGQVTLQQVQKLRSEIAHK